PAARTYARPAARTYARPAARLPSSRPRLSAYGPGYALATTRRFSRVAVPLASGPGAQPAGRPAALAYGPARRLAYGSSCGPAYRMTCGPVCRLTYGPCCLPRARPVRPAALADPEPPGRLAGKIARRSEYSLRKFESMIETP